MIRDSDNARGAFCADFRHALRNAFGETYQKFVTLFVTDQQKAEDGTLFTIYRLFCHQLLFLDLFRQRGIAERRQIFAIQDMEEGDAKTEAVTKYKNALAKEEYELWHNWSFTANVGFSTTLSAIEITYDPQRRYIELDSLEKYSLNPADYHQHLSTTSELLQYVASWANLQAAFLGDIFVWGKDNFRLMKVIMSILDKDPIDPGRIKINANDCEEWDYLNPGYEAETLGRVG